MVHELKQYTVNRLAELGSILTVMTKGFSVFEFLRDVNGGQNHARGHEKTLHLQFSHVVIDCIELLSMSPCSTDTSAVYLTPSKADADCTHAA
jgi:hypothetical protein